MASGEQLLKLVKQELGDHGLVGVWCGTSKLLNNEKDIYDYYDNPHKYRKKVKNCMNTISNASINSCHWKQNPISYALGFRHPYSSDTENFQGTGSSYN